MPVVAAIVAAHALACPSPPGLLRPAGGLRLAILGLAPPPVYPAGHPLQLPQAHEVPVRDALAAAQAWVPQLRLQAALLVVLSHLGLQRDIALAEAVPGIDLMIIGGHSHHRLPALLRIGTTHIAQAGVGGAYLGVVEVSREGTGLTLAGSLEPTWGAPGDDPTIARQMQTYLEERLPAALTPVGTTTGCWADPWAENAWASYVMERLRAAAGTDQGDRWALARVGDARPHRPGRAMLAAPRCDCAALRPPVGWSSQHAGWWPDRTRSQVGARRQRMVEERPEEAVALSEHRTIVGRTRPPGHPACSRSVPPQVLWTPGQLRPSS